MGEKLSEGPSSQENIISRLCCLKISKKRGLSINPDIHHSKVPSSVYIFFLNQIRNNFKNKIVGIERFGRIWGRFVLINFHRFYVIIIFLSLDLYERLECYRINI